MPTKPTPANNMYLRKKAEKQKQDSIVREADLRSSRAANDKRIAAIKASSSKSMTKK